jgi:hypothetical protein
MGISYSTARWAAPLSFAYDFAAQQYGIATGMKEVHDRNLAFWSPNPYFIGAFFFPQQLFQLAWLYRLWKLDPSAGVKESQEAEKIRDFVPWYILGNFCIGSKLSSPTSPQTTEYALIVVLFFPLSLDVLLER